MTFIYLTAKLKITIKSKQKEEKMSKKLEEKSSLNSISTETDFQEIEEKPPSRLCLKCDEEFLPEIEGQRICESCRKSNRRISHIAQGIAWSKKRA